MRDRDCISTDICLLFSELEGKKERKKVSTTKTSIEVLRNVSVMVACTYILAPCALWYSLIRWSYTICCYSEDHCPIYGTWHICNETQTYKVKGGALCGT